MDHKQHETIAKWERRWLAGAALMSLMFIILIALSLALEGTHIAQRSSRTTPEALSNHSLFATPGVTALGPNKYQLTGVAQAFTFIPSEVTLPVGAEVDFYLTSKDVLHGYQLENTTVNVETIPGEISYFKYTFDKLGDYRLSCNEYCGIGHHNMLGKIRIVSASEFAEEARQREAEASAALATGLSGEALYNSNCASCHQANGMGLTGAFPPLTPHAAFSYLQTDDRSYLAKVLLYGLQGQVEVLTDADPGNLEGTFETYNGVMPAWSQLGDAELAAILNYILTSWDNAQYFSSFQPYTVEDIAAERGQALSADDMLSLRQSLGLK